jgi:hypothetical protein
MGFWDAKLARQGNNNAPSTTVPQRRLMDEADLFIGRMNDILTQLQANTAVTQAKQQYHANKHRDTAPNYKVGSLVWLDARNIRTQRPAKKLDDKQLGPFKVLALIGRRSYKLDLPPSMHIHPVFHTCLLTKAANDPLPG